jgi:peptidoglycan/xylan/chitin deacetylase (PgdA/CDA1 family)
VSSRPARIVYSLAAATGIPSAARLFNRKRLLIVVYHGVCVGTPATDVPSWHLVPVHRLRKQLEHLARRYEILPIDEAIDALVRGSMRRNSACVTFDDGYKNNFTLALPVLQQYSAPATIYLATGLIDTERRLWTVQLEIAFRRSEIADIDLSAIGLRSRPLHGLLDRVDMAHRVIRVLKRLTPAAREDVLRQLHRQLPDPGTDTSGQFQMMTWNDAIAMEQSGLVTFGAHTVNHELVARLDDGTLEAELCGSIATIQSRLQRPSHTFAYPNGAVGDFDGRAIRILRNAGVKAAVTTIQGLNSSTADPYTLRRVTVDGYTSFDKFRFMTSGLGMQKPGWIPR